MAEVYQGVVKMELEEIVAKISSESGKTEDEIKDMVEEKREELGGLITPEGAAHVVANGLGINLFKGVSLHKELKIESIIPGMKSVDITGKVVRIFPPREFDRKDGTKGKVCSILLGDETGTIRTVFWGDDVSLIEEEKIVEDCILRIRAGYTKENLNGEAELHIGNRTRVIPNPGDVEPDSIPISREKQKSIKELSEGMMGVDVICKVLMVYEIREFEREGQEPGRVVNLLVGDETGRARLVLWDEDVAMVEKGQIKEGEVIKAKNAYVKVRYDEPEIHIGRHGKVTLKPEAEVGEVPGWQGEIMRKRMEELKSGDRAEIRGALVEVYDSIRIFDKKDGSQGMVINGVIDDGTACMRAAFYDKMAEVLTGLTLQQVTDGDISSELEERRKALLGREVIATVSTRHSDFSGMDELVVQDLNMNPDPREEVKMMMKEAKALVKEV
jgi:replication factor A1